MDTAAIHLTGVRILLQQRISSRDKAASFPVSFLLASPAGFGLLLLFCLLFDCAGFARAQPVARQLPVTVIQSESGGHYAEFTDALREILSAQGTGITIADPSSPYQGSGLVIGVGMKAAAAAAASNASWVINVLIPKAGQDKLVREFPLRAQDHTMSAIYLDQPAERQVELIATAFPDLRKVGVLYGTAPTELVRLRKAMAGHGLVLLEQQVTPASPLPDALQDLLQRIDLLLALPDPDIYNSTTIRNILLATYHKEIPLVGFSPGYVTAGALCAVSSTPRQIAQQAASLIRQLAETGRLPDGQYPVDFDVWVNDQVARSLGIQIREASGLRDSIKAAERKAQ